MQNILCASEEDDRNLLMNILKEQDPDGYSSWSVRTTRIQWLFGIFSTSLLIFFFLYHGDKTTNINYTKAKNPSSCSRR